jgi:hypothetical protein
MDMASLSPAVFYLPDQHEVAKLTSADMDRDWQIFSTGVQVWIGQTYLRLSAAGYPVSLQSVPPERGIVVVHADHAPRLFADRRLLSTLTVIVVRADRPPQPYADAEIVQNMQSATGHAHYVQHWPQPGLISRDLARGDAVRNIAFKGSVGEMADGFKGTDWTDALAAEGMAWRADAAQWTGNGVSYQMHWHDYHDIDAIVALRRDTSHMHVRKPASKLINAWLAGVPAILGPEVAYRELGRPGSDYLEAASPAEAFRALCHLKNSPELYRQLVLNGQRRALEVNAKAVTDRWAGLLFDDMPLLEKSRLQRLTHFNKSLRLKASKVIGHFTSAA